MSAATKENVREMRPLRSLLRNQKKRVRPIVANVITALSTMPEWEGVLGYDEMREAVVKLRRGPWFDDDAPIGDDLGEVTEADITRIVSWFSRRLDVDLSPAVVVDAIAVVARRRPFNSVADYLKSLKWDGVGRLDGWLCTYAGANDTAYVRGVAAKALIAGVARIRRPGCKVDNIPVLEGKQGGGKSSLVRALAPDEALFFDSELDIGDKDAPQALRGKWIVEFGEMSALGRAEAARMKAFVTRQTDTYRPSFGRVARDFPRRWIAFGTTNEDRYLKDPTGNRRWWPVHTGHIDVAGLRRDRDQLWAEAVVRFERGEPWHVNSAEFARLCAAEQEGRLTTDPWEESIGAWYAREKPVISKRGFVTTTNVLTDALKIDPGRQSRTEEMRAAEILVRLGFTRGSRARHGGVRVYPYLPPIREVGGDGVGTASTQEMGSDPNCPNRPINTHTHGEHIAKDSMASGWAVGTDGTREASATRGGR